MTSQTSTQQERADAFIEQPYKGLQDKRGYDFVDHPRGVRDIALRAWENPPEEAAALIAELKRRGVTADDVAAVALLHDMLELRTRSKVRYRGRDLKAGGFSPLVVRAVELLSEKWNPSQHLERRLRQQYRKLRGNSTEVLVARFIKQCDLAHNLLPERLRPVVGGKMTWESSARQIFKYFVALAKHFPYKPIGMPNGVASLQESGPDVLRNFTAEFPKLKQQYAKELSVFHQGPALPDLGLTAVG